MKTSAAIQGGANYLREEMDITSIVERFYSALYRFAVSLTRSETDAADLVQETFLARLDAHIRFAISPKSSRGCLRLSVGNSYEQSVAEKYITK